MTTSFPSPFPSGYTIYSKSKCDYCVQVKTIIQKNHFSFEEINCDDYLLERKEEFLSFIHGLAQKEYRTFPMVFYNGQFVGGFNETKTHVAREACFLEDGNTCDDF